MTIRPEVMARVGLSCIVSVLGAIILMRVRIGNFDESLLYWLLYVICVSLIIVPPEGAPISERLAQSLVSPLVVLMVLAYAVTVEGSALFSVTKVEKGHLKESLPQLMLFFIASLIGIFIFSYSRQAVLEIIKKFMGFDPLKAERIEKLLNYAIKIGGSIALILKVISH